MFQDQCTIFREHIMPGLKLIAHESYYLQGSKICGRLQFWCQLCITSTTCTVFQKNLWLKYD